MATKLSRMANGIISDRTEQRVINRKTTVLTVRPYRPHEVCQIFVPKTAAKWIAACWRRTATCLRLQNSLLPAVRSQRGRSSQLLVTIRIVILGLLLAFPIAAADVASANTPPTDTPSEALVGIYSLSGDWVEAAGSNFRVRLVRYGDTSEELTVNVSVTETGSKKTT